MPLEWEAWVSELRYVSPIKGQGVKNTWPQVINCFPPPLARLMCDIFWIPEKVSACLPGGEYVWWGIKHASGTRDIHSRVGPGRCLFLIWALRLAITAQQTLWLLWSCTPLQHGNSRWILPEGLRRADESSVHSTYCLGNAGLRFFPRATATQEVRERRVAGRSPGGAQWWALDQHLALTLNFPYD